MLRLEVNGETRTVDVGADTPLIHVLREDLGLVSPKLGCGLEQCGACAVLVDGLPVMSCRAPAGEFEGRSILTLEGLGARDAPHPLQAAFLARNAAQCGFCTSGIVLAAKALLDRDPAPSRADIRAALDPHLCRCGSHHRVVLAVEDAARALRGASA